MLSRLARFTVRRRRRILVGSLIALVLAGAFGGSVAKHLSSGGFTDPNAESTKAEQALVRVFGSVVAAGLPLGIGVLAIIGTFLVLRVLASFTQVSIFSLNLTTAMGLGLAIDYSLFIVSRYREEMRTGLEPHDAVIRSVLTAGRTVAFSAMTVAISLAALLIFPLAFLRSFAYAGIAVVAVAAGGALVFLPALLAVLGRGVDKWSLWRRTPKPIGQGFWHRLAML